MNTIIDFTTRLTKKAGKCLLSYFENSQIKTNLKSDRSIVTEADLACNRLITNAIQNNYPEDGIVSEEGETVYPQGRSYVWVIDPLDGTTNFSLGLHYWGVSITRLFNGTPEIAINYFPIVNELYIASKGHGATLNGSSIDVSNIEQKQPKPFFSCCSRTHKRYSIDLKYKTRILGSAAYGLTTVAKGAAILAFEVTPKIWDLSGSWLIIQESGGFIASYNGENIYPLTPGTDYSRISYPILAAISQKEWGIGREKIREKSNLL